MFNYDVWYYIKRKYKGFKIYNEIFFESQGDIGLPQFLLINEKENKIRFNINSEWRELMEILSHSKKIELNSSVDFIILLKDIEYRHCNEEEKRAILDKISNV